MCKECDEMFTISKQMTFKRNRVYLYCDFSHETNCWRNPCLLKSDPRNSCVIENVRDLAVSRFHKSEDSTWTLSFFIQACFFRQRHWSLGRAQSWFRWSYPPGVVVIKPSSLTGGFTPKCSSKGHLKIFGVKRLKPKFIRTQCIKKMWDTHRYTFDNPTKTLVQFRDITPKTVKRTDRSPDPTKRVWKMTAKVRYRKLKSYRLDYVKCDGFKHELIAVHW